MTFDEVACQTQHTRSTASGACLYESCAGPGAHLTTAPVSFTARRAHLAGYCQLGPSRRRRFDSACVVAA